MIKVFKMKMSVVDHQQETVIRFIDISSKILYDSLNTERKYMTYMNSTISHEMRNPLNSICTQIEIMTKTLEEITNFRIVIKDQISVEQMQRINSIGDTFGSSVSTCNSACKMLMFNVEDILALPQLKDGHFTKNIQDTNLSSAIREVMGIQEVQARMKNIMVNFCQSGFAHRDQDVRLHIDEKRFQQVLLNYQSNAIKFIDKSSGRIVICLQLVRAQSESSKSDAVSFITQKTSEIYGSNIFEQRSNAKDPYMIYEPGHRDKIVLSVMDNGIGIKNKDQSKLFKLFGCLNATRQMNTQGIGLGLVISKMITEEFGGQTTIVSRYKYGTVFQSSFQIYNDESCKAESFALQQSRTDSIS